MTSNSRKRRLSDALPGDESHRKLRQRTGDNQRSDDEPELQPPDCAPQKGFQPEGHQPPHLKSSSWADDDDESSYGPRVLPSVRNDAPNNHCSPLAMALSPVHQSPPFSPERRFESEETEIYVRTQHGHDFEPHEYSQGPKRSFWGVKPASTPRRLSAQLSAASEVQSMSRNAPEQFENITYVIPEEQDGTVPPQENNIGPWTCKEAITKDQKKFELEHAHAGKDDYLVRGVDRYAVFQAKAAERSALAKDLHPPDKIVSGEWAYHEVARYNELSGFERKLFIPYIMKLEYANQTNKFFALSEAETLRQLSPRLHKELHDNIKTQFKSKVLCRCEKLGGGEHVTSIQGIPPGLAITYLQSRNCKVFMNRVYQPLYFESVMSAPEFSKIFGPFEPGLECSECEYELNHREETSVLIGYDAVEQVLTLVLAN